MNNKSKHEREYNLHRRGICPQCGKRKAVPGMWYCPECQEYFRQKSREWYQANKDYKSLYLKMYRKNQVMNIQIYKFGSNENGNRK